MGLSSPLFLSLSIFFLSSAMARSLRDLQWKAQPTSRMATTSMTAKPKSVMLVCLVLSTSKAAIWQTQGMENEQIDSSCSMSPFARQLVVLICTSTFQVDSAALSSLQHSISAAASVILKKERKVVPTPTANAEDDEENSSMLLISSTPRPLRRLEGCALLASMRTCRLMAQAVRKICSSPLISSLGFSQLPKRRMRSASLTWLQYLLRVSASAGCWKLSLQQNSATQLTPPSLQMVWMVDSYLLIWKHSRDYSSTVRCETLPFLPTRQMTSCWSTSPQNEWPSLRTSQNSLEGGGRISAWRVAVVKSTEVVKMWMAEFQTIRKVTVWELQSTLEGWNFSSSLVAAQEQFTKVRLASLLRVISQVRSGFSTSTPTILTPSVTTRTFLISNMAMSMDSSAFSPSEATEMLMGRWVQEELVKSQATMSLWVEFCCWQLSLLRRRKTVFLDSEMKCVSTFQSSCSLISLTTSRLSYELQKVQEEDNEQAFLSQISDIDSSLSVSQTSPEIQQPIPAQLSLKLCLEGTSSTDGRTRTGTIFGAIAL